MCARVEVLKAEGCLLLGPGIKWLLQPGSSKAQKDENLFYPAKTLEKPRNIGKNLEPLKRVSWGTKRMFTTSACNNPCVQFSATSSGDSSG